MKTIYGAAAWNTGVLVPEDAVDLDNGAAIEIPTQTLIDNDVYLNDAIDIAYNGAIAYVDGTMLVDLLYMPYRVYSTQTETPVTIAATGNAVITTGSLTTSVASDIHVVDVSLSLQFSDVSDYRYGKIEFYMNTAATVRTVNFGTRDDPMNLTYRYIFTGLTGAAVPYVKVTNLEAVTYSLDIKSSTISDVVYRVR